MFKRKSKTEYYRSLDELPIWNWHMVHKENDYKYICKKGRPDKRAPQVYAELSYSFERLDLPLLKAKRDVLLKVIDLVIDIIKQGKPPEEMEKARIILEAIMISGDHGEWMYQFDIADTPSQKRLMSQIMVAIKKHKQLQENMRDNPQSLNEKVVMIERLLKVNIDVKTCSVNLFMEYQKQSVDATRKRMFG